MYNQIPRDNVSVNLPYVENEENIETQKVVPMRLKEENKDILKKSTETIRKMKEEALARDRERVKPKKGRPRKYPKKEDESKSKEEEEFDVSKIADKRNRKNNKADHPTRRSKRIKRGEEDSDESYREENDDSFMDNLGGADLSKDNQENVAKPFEYFPVDESPLPIDLLKLASPQPTIQRNDGNILENQFGVDMRQASNPLNILRREDEKANKNHYQGVDFEAISSPLVHLNNSSRIIPNNFIQKQVSNIGLNKLNQTLQSQLSDRHASAFEKGAQQYAHLKSPELFIKNNPIKGNIGLQSPYDFNPGARFAESPMVMPIFNKGMQNMNHLALNIPSNAPSPMIPQKVNIPQEMSKEIVKEDKDAASSGDESYNEMQRILKVSKATELDNKKSTKMEKRRNKLKKKGRGFKLNIPAKNKFLEDESVKQPSAPAESPSRKMYSPTPTRVLAQFNESEKKGQALFNSGCYPQNSAAMYKQYQNQLSNSMFKSDKDDNDKPSY